MRVSKAQAAQNREKILLSAARLFREQGIGATGVDAITEQAGLTHGGLYSQFGSKDAIAVEAIRFAFARSRRKWQRAAEKHPGKRTLPAIVDGYLSRAHRDSPGDGCVVATLGADIARHGAALRQAFTEGLKDGLESLAGLMPAASAADRYDAAIAAFAGMAGAVILARAVSDPALSDRILSATARRILGRSATRRSARSSSPA
ncbi:MAG: TetR/AcrR family transcriptional regulator [Candidatus Binataceae bacterium]|nr:TetR/AcrR family transcriptional regulator [Candidatus Binataceae bacterium]